MAAKTRLCETKLRIDGNTFSRDSLYSPFVARKVDGVLSMKPRTVWQLPAIASLVLTTVLFLGFALAYGAAAGGLLGLLPSWRVALFTIYGSAVSFIGIVGYFLVETRRLRHG
jgi:hypothetical protein